MKSSNTVAALADDLDIADVGVRWVLTDAYGMLIEASREAAQFLNLSKSALRSRQLLTFFDGEREHWREALRAAATGLMVDREGALRPREKRPVRVRAEIISKPRPGSASAAYLWTFTAPEDQQGRRAVDVQPF